MKQFTFSAQVANNLLKVLQGYTKGIRFIALLTILCTIGVGQMCGQATLPVDYSFSNGKSSLPTGVTSSGLGSDYAESHAPYRLKFDGNNDYIQIQTNAAAQQIIFAVKMIGGGSTSYFQLQGSSDGTSFTNIENFTISGSQNAVVNCTTSVAINSSYRYFKFVFTKGSNVGFGTLKISKAAASSFTITAQSNNNSYGTVSVSGTTITATPNAGYRVKSGDAGYTVTSGIGTATVTNNGDNTFSVTPSSNCTITINFEAIPQYTVTWDVNGDQSVTTQVTEGSKPTFPATPSSCDATSNTFYGWATATWDGKIDDVSAKTIYTSANDMPAVNGAVTYYAVFATKGAGGGAAFDGTSGGDFKIYALVEGEKKYLSGTGSKISPVDEAQATEYTFTKDGSVFYIQTGTTYLTYASSTNLGTSTEPYDWNISEGTKGSWRIASVTSSGRGIVYRASTYNQFGGYSTSNITADGTEYYDVEIGGGASVSYSGYITTCAAGDPCASLQAPNVTATATANSITLSWDAVDGATSYNVYNYTTADLDETTSLTYTFTGLSSETEYEWGVESAKDECFKETRGTTTTPAAASPATITLSELGVTSTIDTYSVGAQYTLPTTSSQSCDGKQLVGWSTVEVAETDTKPTSNYYELGAEVTLAATQTFYAVFAAGSGGGGETTVNLSIGDYATANSWSNATQYATVNIDENITATATGGGNTGKYYTSGTNWRIYENEDPTLTITAKDGCTIKQITITYNVENTGILTFGGSNISSGTACEINATSAVFGVGNTNSATNGQVRITQISVTYSGGGGYTAYSTSCIPTYSITYDFAGGTGSHCSNTSVPQGDPYTICDEAPTKEGNTFLHWSDGTSTYAAGATFTPTKNTTLTAQWQINTYTVTWSVNGDTTEESYEHGETLNVPDPNDIPSCDGEKEFVGWTDDNTFTYHATDAPTPLFKTTIATVTADKTYYAVFATPPGTGGGGGGSETNTTLDFTAQGYADATAISNLTVDGVTATFAKGSNGSNAPKYYTSGTAIRAYGGNTITLSANQITAATFTFGSSDGSNEITADCGSWNSPTWTGDATDEVVFTIGGTSGNRRIKSIAVTYTSGGGSGSYSDYTTTCQQVESIEVQSPQTEFHLTDDFTIGSSGKVIATLSGGGTTDVTGSATFSGYNMEVVGTYTVTVTYMGATATYNINVQPLDNAWVLTWNVSGKTNTGLGPRYVTKGEAIGTLPTPVVPDACAGKTFMGWTTSNIVNSDGTGITYITPETVPTDNTTYYAVFATVNNFCTQKPIDQITSGSKVVIVAVASLTDDGGAGKAISSRATVDTHNLQGDDVAIYDQTINTPHSTCIWTITKSGEKYIFTQDGKYLNGIIDGSYSNLKYNSTSDSWSLSNAASGMAMTYNMKSTNASTEYVEWYNGKFTIHNEVNTNGAFDMQFFVTANEDGNADITDYTTGCAEYTITYYGFHGGYSTSCSSDGTIVLPVNSLHTVPNCGDVVTDHTNLGREFLNVWMTQPHGGHTFKPGDTFILTQDTTLYAQWKMETTSDVTTLPTDIEDLAGTDIYVYGGTTLNIQPGTTTINSLTLKGGLQADGSYKMPTVWVPEGATLVRNSNKINLDLIVNAKTWYPFAVPFATKNNQYVEYLDPVLAAASTYGTHFAIKTYDGARRADVGEDKANNWVRVLRDETLQPGVGYIITALTYPTEDTATIRIPMTVSNTWFQNGEQAAVNTTVRNTIAVTAHAGAAATEHQRHAGWNFVANPYLTSFAGGNVANDGGLAYINGELIIEGSYEYTDEEVPYVTVPAYDFAYYSQHKLSDVKLSPEWSFFVQVGTGGTMNFTTAGRQQAPASIAARNAEERPVKMDVDLILSDNHSSDQTGIIICDRYTDAYEIGRDLEKLFGSAYNLSVYTLMEDNTPLAFQALAIRSSMQVIPVGYRAPEQGEYTFRLNEATSSIDLLNEQYEQLVLVDYQTGELTNLLYTDYTFYSERTQSNSRFAIYAVPRQNAPTDLPNAIGSDEEVRKVIYNDHLYILRDGNVYNGMGQKM